MQHPGITKSKTRNPRRSGVGTGTTSLLVIFTLLCLSTLALLSLSTASSNRRITQRGFSNMHNLTHAKGEASLMLADIDATLADNDNYSAEGYYLHAENALYKLGCEINADAHTATFFVPVNENSNLVTHIQILPPQSEFRYTLLGQTMVMVGEWTPDGGGNVWDGG